jgi:hypothetical protein
MKKVDLANQILEKANICKKRANKGHIYDKRHDPVLKDEKKAYLIAYDKLKWSYRKIGSHFDRDLRTVEKVIKSHKINKQTAKPGWYEETPHRQKMRDTAKSLAAQIRLPSILGKDFLRDFSIELEPGTHSWALGSIDVSEEKQIKFTYHDPANMVAEPHIIEALYSHVGTSELTKFTELVGEEGKLQSFIYETGKYLQELHKFLQLIVDEVQGYGSELNFNDEVKPGLTKWFAKTVWVDALQITGGFPWIDESWYSLSKSNTLSGLWQLRCGAYILDNESSKDILTTHKDWHKNLRAKYAGHQLAKDIYAKSEEINTAAQEIKQRLEEFSDMDHLPGHCGLCQIAGPKV